MAPLAQCTEWYDFFVYTTAAAIIFPQVCFSGAGASSSVVATLISFVTVAVGFIARPIGGLVFGHLGDRHGRKPALLFALSLMGVASLAIACLPTYATWSLRHLSRSPFCVSCRASRSVVSGVAESS